MSINRCKEYYKRNFLNMDIIFALLITIILFIILIYYFDLNAMVVIIEEFKSNFYIAVSTIAGTLLGFIITTISIIIIFIKSPELKELEKAKNTRKDLFKTYTSTLKWLAGLTVISLIILMSPIFLNVILFYLSLFFGFVVIFRLYWCFWVLENLAEIIYSK